MDLKPSFIKRIQNEFGADANSFLLALENDPIISVRFNTSKVGSVACRDIVPWASNAIYLEKRPIFTLDPLFNVGAYYVQEASSMFVEQVFKQHVTIDDNLVVLDLCASPGGKSTLLASLMNGRGLLVSNEVVSQRVAPLRENITKWGYSNCVVTNSDPSIIGKCEGLFDVILVDAPCSGEGMFRKDPQSVTEWSPENVQMCAERQRAILRDVFPSLKDGGLLIYSTCTYNTQEDEDNVKWVCSQLGGINLTIDYKSEWGIVDSGLGYHFYPYKAKGEGFFISAIKKDCATKCISLKSKRVKSNYKTDFRINELICNSNEFIFSESKDNMVLAYNKSLYDSISLLKNNARVVQSGVQIAQMKGKDLVPATHLAMSSILNRNVVNEVELDWKNAMSFLKKESFILNDSPKGWLLATYRGIPLGWLKNLGTRTNSGYPSEWHVRMDADESLYTPII